MARVHYRPDHVGTARLLVSDEFRAMVDDAAEAGKSYAESIAPRETGTYAASFAVDSATRGSGFARDRAQAVLVNTAEHAAAVEWALGYRILGRTVDVIEGGGS